MCDCEPADVYYEVQPRAAKHYWCEECSASIERGQRYTRINMLFDGMWWSHTVCGDCSAAATRFREVSQCCWPVGGLGEELHEFLSCAAPWDDPDLRAMVARREANAPAARARFEAWLAERECEAHPS